MNINIKTTNFQMTPAIQNYLNKKVLMLDKFIDPNDESAHLDIEVGKSVAGQMSGEIFRVEFNLLIAGTLYRATEEQSDTYASIDAALDDLTRQIRKSRKKRFALFKKGARKMKGMLQRGFRKRN